MSEIALIVIIIVAMIILLMFGVVVIVRTLADRASITPRRALPPNRPDNHPPVW